MESSVNDNVKAFLFMLRQCEGTAGANGYRTVYDYEKVLQNLSDHPYYTGEWKGKRLSDSMCRNAGLKPPCYSTAAGAYQFLKGTWKALQQKLKLTDFSERSQDLAAIEKLRELGALDYILSGDLETAIDKASGTWASLPGNKAKQPQKTLAQATSYYKNAGGKLA